MNVRRAVFVSSSVALALACGGAQPPPPPVTAQVVTAPPPPPPAPELTAVDEPAQMVFFGRVARPADVLKIAGGWTRLPMPGSDVAAEMLTGERTGKIVDLEQPVDVDDEYDEHHDTDDSSYDEHHDDHDHDGDDHDGDDPTEHEDSQAGDAPTSQGTDEDPHGHEPPSPT